MVAKEGYCDPMRNWYMHRTLYAKHSRWASIGEPFTVGLSLTKALCEWILSPDHNIAFTQQISKEDSCPESEATSIVSL